MSFDDLVSMLQGAIGAVMLISVVGLLLLSMTNRFSRVLDISRQPAVRHVSAGADRLDALFLTCFNHSLKALKLELKSANEDAK